MGRVSTSWPRSFSSSAKRASISFSGCSGCPGIDTQERAGTGVGDPLQLLARVLGALHGADDVSGELQDGHRVERVDGAAVCGKKRRRDQSEDVDRGAGAEELGRERERILGARARLRRSLRERQEAAGVVLRLVVPRGPRLDGR